MKAIAGLMSVSLAVGIVLSANAPAQTKGDAKAGKSKYEAMCVGCHGATGKGDGPAASSLNPKPADLSDPAYVQSLSDRYLFQIIKDGGSKVNKSPLMPGWAGALNDQDIWNVIAYLKTLSKAAR
ncbi:MAG TPA: c-type cytochrome [Candidatus Acidoferrales bacterium]|nr:c-type cytochrome [Candidatus Acidoferrales bacterium]